MQKASNNWKPFLLNQGHKSPIMQDEYAQKKRSFLNEKMDLQDKVAAFARQGAKHNSDKTGVNRFEPTLEFLKESIHVGELAESGKPEENREKLKKIGSSFRISGRRLSFELKKPWEFLLNFNSLRAREFGKMSKKQQCEKIRRGRDSNPRSTFGAYRLSRSAPSTARPPLHKTAGYRG